MLAVAEYISSHAQAKVQPPRYCISSAVSNALGSRTEQVTKFVQQLLGEKQLAKTEEFERIPSMIKNHAGAGTPAIVAGALLFCRAVLSPRHGYLKALAEATLGIAVFYIGVRQRHLDASRISFKEQVVDRVTDDKEQLEAKTGNPGNQYDLDEKSDATTSRNGNEQELGGNISGERSDPAFTADAETQGRSQPSLNADVHDPRRGRGEKDFDPSETALPDDSTESADSSTEQDWPAQTDESEEVLSSEEAQPDNDENSMDEDGPNTPQTGDSDDTNSEENTAGQDMERTGEGRSEDGK